MPRMVRGGLIQATLCEPVTSGVEKVKQAMIDKHVALLADAADKGVEVVCMQELFYGPYFCAEQDAKWYDLTERVPDGPTVKLINWDQPEKNDFARLDFSEAELAQFTEQLGKIVNFVEQLSAVDTTGIEPMAHPLDVHSILRADKHQPGLSRDQALANSPNHDHEFFLVPPVMTR